MRNIGIDRRTVQGRGSSLATTLQGIAVWGCTDGGAGGVGDNLEEKTPRSLVTLASDLDGKKGLIQVPGCRMPYLVECIELRSRAECLGILTE